MNWSAAVNQFISDKKKKSFIPFFEDQQMLTTTTEHQQKVSHTSYKITINFDPKKAISLH